MKSDFFKFAENSSHNFTWILIPFIKAGIYDIYVNSVTYIRVKMDSHTYHFPYVMQHETLTPDLAGHEL